MDQSCLALSSEQIFPAWFDHCELIESMRAVGGVLGNLDELQHTEENSEHLRHQKIAKYDLLFKIKDFRKLQVVRVASLRHQLRKVEDSIISPTKLSDWKDDSSDEEDDENARDDVGTNSEEVARSQKALASLHEQLRYQAVISAGLDHEMGRFAATANLGEDESEEWVQPTGTGTFLAGFLEMDLRTAQIALMINVKDRLSRLRDLHASTGIDTSVLDEKLLKLEKFEAGDKAEQLRIQNQLLEPASPSEHDFEYNPDDYVSAVEVVENEVDSQNNGSSLSFHTAVTEQDELYKTEVGIITQVHPPLAALYNAASIAPEVLVCAACKTFGYSASYCFCDIENALEAQRYAELGTVTVASIHANAYDGLTLATIPLRQRRHRRQNNRDWYVDEQGYRRFKCTAPFLQEV